MVTLIQAGARKERLLSFHGGICEVIAVLGARRVDLKPLVDRPVDSDSQGVVFEELPAIPNVPVFYLQAGPFSLTFPLEKGMTGLYLGLTYSHDEWFAKGERTQPGDTRVQHLGNGIFLPGVTSDALISAYVDDPDCVIHGKIVRIGGDATDFAALASKCDQNFSDIFTTFGSLTAPSGGGAVTGTPYSPTATACENLKIK